MRVFVLGIIAAIVTLSAPVRVEAGFLGGDASRSPGQQLKTLFAEYWADELRSEPLEATFVGDHRFDDRLADLTEPAREARLARDRSRREALGRIDPSALTPDERLD